jgi:hypothetical protein
MHTIYVLHHVYTYIHIYIYIYIYMSGDFGSTSREAFTEDMPDARV